MQNYVQEHLRELVQTQSPSPSWEAIAAIMDTTHYLLHECGAESIEVAPYRDLDFFVMFSIDGVEFMMMFDFEGNFESMVLSAKQLRTLRARMGKNFGGFFGE